LSARTLARGAASAAALAALLLSGGTAAASITLPLHAAHRNTTAAGFSTHSCDQIPDALRGGGSDGWVFVLPANDADFVSLSLKFRDTGGTEVTIAVPNAADSYPDGIATNGTSKAWVVVPAGWTLLDGTAVVDNDKTKADDFNLTHTCPGTPGTPSTSPSTSTSPSGSTSASPDESGSPSSSPSGSVEASVPPTVTPAPSTPGGGGGSLPVTGVAITGTVVTGGALVAAGAALLAVRRRRMRLAFVADPDASSGPEPEAGER
jgi:LPXTG-motif cell wall-anchored protein